MVFKGRFFGSQKQSKQEGGSGRNGSQGSGSTAGSSGVGGNRSAGTISKNEKKKGAIGKSENKKETDLVGQDRVKDSRVKKEIAGKDAAIKSKEAESAQSKHEIQKRDTSTKLKKVPAVDRAEEKSPSPGRSTKELFGNGADVDRSSNPASPIMASSLGLNRIKTRSGPLPQENYSFDHFRRFVPNLQDGLPAKGSNLGASKLSRTETCSTSTSNATSTVCSTLPIGGKSSKNLNSCHSSSCGSGSVSGNNDRESLGASLRKESKNGATPDDMSCGCWVDKDNNFNAMSTSCQSMGGSPAVQGSFRFQPSSHLQNETKASSWGSPGCSSSTDTHIQESEAPCGTSDGAKETESPRFQALLRVTRGPWKNKLTHDIKSFSHELDPRGVRPFPSWKPRNFNNIQVVLGAIRVRFDKAKEEVNSDLAIFAGDLVEILEKTAEAHPEWKESLEDLLVLARQCDMMSPGEFWLQCEGIVQDLDDRRQELPMGVLKQLHTRLLFILTRCTRLLQFHKEHGLDEDGNISRFHPQATGASHVEKPTTNKNEKTPTTIKQSITPRFFSEEQKFYNWEGREKAIPPSVITPRPSETGAIKSIDSLATRDRLSSWKKLPSAGDTTQKRNTAVKEISSEVKSDSIKMSDKRQTLSDGNIANAKALEHPLPKESSSQSSVSSKHQHRISWGYWGDQQNLSEETYAMICRICEEEVPTSHLEEHLRLCTIADRCDLKGLSVDERLRRIAETLEKIMESYTPKSSQAMGGGSPDVGKACNMSVTEESEGPSPKLSDWSRRGSEDMLDYLQEIDGMDESRGLSTMSCKTRFGPKSEQGMATSSVGSMTPRSPLTTPRASQIDMLLADKTSFCEYEDLPQINELVDIARCVANSNWNDEGALEYLVSCLEDLRDVLQHCKAAALTVDTFGRRIERLLREKYLHFCELVQPEEEKVDTSSSIVDEDGPMEDDVLRSLRASPVHPASKDRTSIDDFEILKPISRGAFGRVFLAKKRTTGDLFAIKVLRKADMIRKNAVESILAERDILISVRNPFVVRFFYSFTCRDNLYLVMEYLNGGDLYSLLRNLGCLDEDMARVYIAEVVLALEYLHSLHVVHRDLKPDNLLIAHDGHIKLTDFGLSKVGLINSTDDLSGPAVSGTMLLGEDEDSLCATEQSDQRERRQKRSAVGTPDYLAPEILLGTGHAETADWWSVGVILFELLTGIPPFNAEHPQTIFDNILNRKIPWPAVPEEMSYEAMDLIDKLLTEDPNQRLGAKGAAEVKRHPYFKDINWDTLQRQKAAFVPASDGALDTSYFTSRYMWNSSEGNAYSANNFEDISDCDSSSGSSSSFINGPDEVIDESLAKFDNTPSVNYSFSNFSFKNLSQLASINYDLLTISGKDSPKGSDSHSSIA